ncbi:S8 family serine peptidase [bacterium]|nr:S8 family serine peptidase [bacterium]
MGYNFHVFMAFPLLKVCRRMEMAQTEKMCSNSKAIAFILAAIIIFALSCGHAPAKYTSPPSQPPYNGSASPDFPANTQIPSGFPDASLKPQPIPGRYLAFTSSPDTLFSWAEQRNIEAELVDADATPSSENPDNVLPPASLVEITTNEQAHILAAELLEGVYFVSPRKTYPALSVTTSPARSPSFLPDDPFYVEAETDDTTEPPTLIPYQKTTLEPVSAEGAWDIARGTGIKVAIISSGVYEAHPDLAGRISGLSKSFSEDNGDVVEGADISDESYIVTGAIGTYLAGIVAANINNELGLAGIAPECELVILKTGHIENISAPTWAMNDLEINAALRYAADIDVSVVLLPVAVVSIPADEPVIEGALTYCETNDTLVVVPAGDGETPVDASTIYPANSARENVIAVGGLHLPTTIRLFTSNFDAEGGTIDFATPGFALITTDSRPEDPEANPPITGYVYANGTAMSAALAAGAGALVADAMGEQLFQIDAVREIMLGAVDTWGDLGVSDPLVGPGRLNINLAAVRAYAQVNVPRPLRIAQVITNPDQGKNGTVYTSIYVYTTVNGGTKPYTVRIEWGDGTSFPPGPAGFSQFGTGVFSHIYEEVGNYPVTIAFKDAAGQERIEARTFSIMSPFTATISAQHNPKNPLQFIFKAEVMNADVINPVFYWDFNGDWKFDSNGQNPVHTYDTPGTYRVNFQVSDSRSTVARTINVTAG